MKFACISDLHFKLYRGNNSFVPFVEKAVENFIDICDKRGVDCVLVGGDIFHAKSYVQTFALNRALGSLRKLTQKYETHMILGNHDIYVNQDSEKINLLKVFESDCTVYDDYHYVDFNDELRIHFLPYFPDEIVKEKIKNMVFRHGKKNILFTHLAVRGFSMTEFHENITSELDADYFKQYKFDAIISGHFHDHQVKGNIAYISSPLESHFGDEGKKGYLFFDSADPLGTLEFIENKFSPKFITMELNKENSGKILSLKDSFVRIKVKKHIEYSLLHKLKKQLESKNHFVTFDFEVNDSIQSISVVDGWSDFIYEDTVKLIEKYVESINTPFDKKKLLNFVLD